MDERRAERRLVVILAADVAGYGRLTAADQEGRIVRLGRLRDERPCIASTMAVSSRRWATGCWL